METKTRRDALTVAGLIERFIDRYAKATPRSWRDSDAVLKFDCILGAPGRATTYKWKNDCLNQILNIELDQRIIEKEEEKNNKETERTDDIEVSRKRSTKVIATAKKRNCCSDHKGLNRSSAVAGASAKNTHYNSAEKAQHNAHQCVENSAHFAEKTEHLHTHSSLKDSLPNEGSVSTH